MQIVYGTIVGIADGTEKDWIGFDFGRTARIGSSAKILELVVG